MPEQDAELVLPVGVLYCRRDHREWWRGGAGEEPHLRGVRLLHDQLYLPGCGRMDMGLRLVGLSAGRGLPGCVCFGIRVIGMQAVADFVLDP